jgi:hypothetical protein
LKKSKGDMIMQKTKDSQSQETTNKGKKKRPEGDEIQVDPNYSDPRLWKIGYIDEHHVCQSTYKKYGHANGNSSSCIALRMVDVPDGFR